MALLVNVAPAGEAPRIVNIDNVLEMQLWVPPDGEPGTLLRMACPHSRGTVAEGPFTITVRTPFAEIIKRMRFEALAVGTPVAKE